MLVYMLLNQVTGKSYIGQTRAYSLNKRWDRWLSNAPNRYLRAAIKKYGAENFSRDVLAETSNQDEADSLERCWIAILRSADRRYGYNLDLGGKAGPRHSEETKRAIRAGVNLFWRNIPAEKKERHTVNCRKIWTNKRRKVQMIARVSKSLRLVWQSRTEAQRQRHRWNVGAAQRGISKHRPAWNKGMKFGCYSDEHRKHISEAVTRWWSRKRGGNLVSMRSAEQSERSWYMAKPPKVFVQLTKETVQILQDAYSSLERGGDTKDARSRLKEIGRKLLEIEWEYKGCNW